MVRKLWHLAVICILAFGGAPSVDAQSKVGSAVVDGKKVTLF
ncbi:hypothetical protein [Shimia abyssi]|nr:hypothetical protein [Shimia abyssi]